MLFGKCEKFSESKKCDTLVHLIPWQTVSCSLQRNKVPNFSLLSIPTKKRIFLRFDLMGKAKVLIWKNPLSQLMFPGEKFPTKIFYFKKFLKQRNKFRQNFLQFTLMANAPMTLPENDEILIFQSEKFPFPMLKLSAFLKRKFHFGSRFLLVAIFVHLRQ